MYRPQKERDGYADHKGQAEAKMGAKLLSPLSQTSICFASRPELQVLCRQQRFSTERSRTAIINLLKNGTSTHQMASLLAGKMNELAVRDLDNLLTAAVTKQKQVVVSTLAMCAEQAEERGLGLK